MIFKAIEFAARAHTGQNRKGTKIPYIVHPLGVAKVLIDHGSPDYLVAAGILHDTTEDTPVTLEQITETFGPRIAELVKDSSEPDKSKKWEDRKKHTIEQLETISNEAVILALADKLDNIRAIREDLERSGESVWKRFNAPKDQQKWYYESLVRVISSRLTDEHSMPMLNLFRQEVTRVFGL